MNIIQSNHPPLFYSTVPTSHMAAARADLKRQNRRPCAAHVAVPRFRPYHRSSVLQFENADRLNYIFLLQVWTSKGDLRICEMVDGWEVPFETYYSISCTAIPRNGVGTHPPSSGISGGHMKKQSAALCVVFCGGFRSCVPKGTTSGLTQTRVSKNPVLTSREKA